MLSRNTYCSSNRGQSDSSRVKKDLHSTIQNFNITMGSKKFYGLDPLSILIFLTKLKLESNNSHASEGLVKLFLATFLKDDTLMAYESALHVDSVDADSIGIIIWVD